MRKIQIDAPACLWGAVMLLVLPLKWLAAAFSAALVHELTHYCVIRMLGGKVNRITIGSGGAALETSPMTPGKEFLCALAGPLGGMLLVCLARFFPLTALCALAQTLFNLLPIYPMDGGRALRCAAELLFPGIRAERLCAWVSGICTAALTALTVYGIVRYRMGLFILLPLLLLWWKVLPRKRPCKTASLRLQ